MIERNYVEDVKLKIDERKDLCLKWCEKYLKYKKMYEIEKKICIKYYNEIENYLELLLFIDLDLWQYCYKIQKNLKDILESANIF